MLEQTVNLADVGGNWRIEIHDGQLEFSNFIQPPKNTLGNKKQPLKPCLEVEFPNLYHNSVQKKLGVESPVCCLFQDHSIFTNIKIAEFEPCPVPFPNVIGHLLGWLGHLHWHLDKPKNYWHSTPRCQAAQTAQALLDAAFTSAVNT